MPSKEKFFIILEILDEKVEKIYKKYRKTIDHTS